MITGCARLPNDRPFGDGRPQCAARNDAKPSKLRDDSQSQLIPLGLHVDPRYVIIDLDFDQPGEAQAFLEQLKQVWSRTDLSPGLAREGGAAVPPRTRIVHEGESGVC